jgi:RTA1 like protein
MVAFYAFSAFFAVRLFRYRVPSSCFPFVFALAEAGGYTARVIFAENKAPLRDKHLAQLIILILAPNIAQAFLYVITSRLMRACKVSDAFVSRNSKWLPSFFVISDLLCLSVQSYGGAGLAQLPDNASHARERKFANILLAGLGLQLAFLGLFLIVFWWFIYALSKSMKSMGARLQQAIVGVTAAVALVSVRNSYRVAEFAQGSFSHGSLGQHEWYYFGGDTILMLLVCAVFAVCHLEDRAVYTQLEDMRDGKNFIVSEV